MGQRGRGEEEKKEGGRIKADGVVASRLMEEWRTTRGWMLTGYVVTGSSIKVDLAPDSARHEWSAAGRTTLGGKKYDWPQTRAIPTCGHIQPITAL